MIRRLILLLAAIATFCAFPAAAHTSASSEVTLEAGETAITAEAIIPAAEYSYASGNPATNDPPSLREAQNYLLKHTEMHSGDGRNWQVSIEETRFVKKAGMPDLLARIRYTPPSPSVTDRFVFRWSAVIANTPDHVTTVLLDERDLSGPRLIGLLREGSTEIGVVAGRSSAFEQFAAAIKVGAEHILGGLDHLAFLMALLLAAPLLARDGRWRDLRTGKQAVKALALVATGFTIGHSLTLIGVTLTGITLPGPAVEVFIAATVLVTAINVIRPIFAKRELWIAVLFGLVHGLGFAGFVSEADANLTRNLSTLIGFNFGLELVQIGVILIVVPLLLLIAKRGFYRPFRVLAAAILIASSGYWIASRTASALA